jgi:hypothetical protein
MNTVFWLEKPKGRDHLKYLEVDGNIINGSSGNRVGECELDLSGSG